MGMVHAWQKELLLRRVWVAMCSVPTVKALNSSQRNSLNKRRGKPILTSMGLRRPFLLSPTNIRHGSAIIVQINWVGTFQVTISPHFILTIVGSVEIGNR